MQIFNLMKKPDYKIEKKSIVAFGNFDGVHLGHQYILNKVLSNDKTMAKGVITFSGLSKLKNTYMIFNEEDKYEQFKKMGFHFVIVINIEYFKHMEPKDFISLLKDQVNIKKIIIGKNLKFGKNRKGDYKIIQDMIDEVERVDLLKTNNLVISSTIIRSLIDEGAVDEAAKLLGRYFSVKGRVFRGEKIGRKLGTPTANLDVDPLKINLQEGIYYSFTIVKNKKYFSITSVGKKPTLKEASNIIYETHIFDFNEDIYDETITVEFIKYLRPQKKFGNIEELEKAINEDKKIVKQYFVNKQNK